MNIQELEDKHKDIVLNPLSQKNTNPVEHTKLSIEFAIRVLEELPYTDEVMLHIHELKQYLNEEC